MNEQHKQQPLAIDVISIQSQVIYGCVGNNAAAPTFQQRGLTVACVPTVLFSNTPLYPSIHGGVISDEWFAGFLQGIDDRAFLSKVRAIQLGYLGSPSQARLLTAWLDKIAAQYPDINVIIDPVMGDVDVGMYIDPNLAAEYRNHLCACASGLTPNHYELEFLTGRSIKSSAEAIAAAKTLLSDKTKWVIVTSAVASEWQAGEMQFIIVTAAGHDVHVHPYLHIEAKGTGDVFAACLSANLLREMPLKQAAIDAAQHVMKVIKRTNDSAVNELMLIEEIN